MLHPGMICKQHWSCIHLRVCELQHMSHDTTRLYFTYIGEVGCLLCFVFSLNKEVSWNIWIFHEHGSRYICILRTQKCGLVELVSSEYSVPSVFYSLIESNGCKNRPLLWVWVALDHKWVGWATYTEMHAMMHAMTISGLLQSHMTK